MSLTWLFFAGLGYAGISLVLTYRVQRIPRSPVVDPPDWGRVADARIPAADGGWLEAWKVTPKRPNGHVVLFAQAGAATGTG